MPILLVTLPIISALDGKTDNHTEEKEIHTDATAQDTIGGQLLGLMRTPSINLNIPQGLYEVTIQSIFPFIKTSAIVRIDEGVHNVLEFEDKEKYWDLLFSIDMILWIISLFINLQKPYSTIYHIYQRFCLQYCRVYHSGEHLFLFCHSWIIC